MEHWLLIDLVIVFVYGLQHSLLTTKIAVKAFESIFPKYTWNIIYSMTSVVTLVIGFYFWEKSNVAIFYLVPGSFAYHVFSIGLALSLFLFFYCFRFTTSFWQWLGIRQIVSQVLKEKAPEYYRIRKEGIKRYIRFPHHTCLIFFFWLHPIMTLDTLLLAVTATVYLYIGTYHQDLRGLRMIGAEWSNYRKETSLLFPSVRVFRRMIVDCISSVHLRRDVVSDVPPQQPPAL